MGSAGTATTTSGSLLASEGLRIGTTAGNLITNSYVATASLDFPSTASGTSTGLVIAVTGALLGQPVVLGFTNYNAGWLFDARASNDAVHVRFHNISGTAADPTSSQFKVRVFQ
jgi:hypothetical protein